MNEEKSIPASKVQRAARFLKTGAKVGANYLKHYAKKTFTHEDDTDELNRKNAEEIYKTLSELKGGALKIAQMLSMDKGVLPKEYAKQFVQAQYSAPPLSGPLVARTIRSQLGKGPDELFDTFDMQAMAAASIGQVHKATRDGKTFAVKVQYPGVAESIKSDLKMVKFLAPKIARVSAKELEKYFDEIEERLLEETDYRLELKRSREIGEACRDIHGLVFPEFYPELSSDRVLTMEYLSGKHMREFLADDPPAELRNAIGQALWDFITFQMHQLGRVHADPHPGNFLFREDGTVGILDFGCVKEIPKDFYQSYFSVIHPDVRGNPEKILSVAYQLELLEEEDTEAEKSLVISLLQQFLDMVQVPFFSDEFDFSDDAYIGRLYEFGMEVGKMEQVRDTRVARGSRHALYINRTYFGLFTLLNELKATVRTRDKYILALNLS